MNIKSVNIKYLIPLLFIVNIFFAQKIYKNENPQWKPVEDKVYLQEVSTKIFTENEITSIAAYDDKFYVVMNSEIYFINEENIEKISSSQTKVNRII